MNLETKYILTINFNVDNAMIFESRAIKRVTEDMFVSTQYLKGNMKEYPNQNHFLTKELNTYQHVNIEKHLSLNEFKKIMQPSFDLFDDLQAVITNEDTPILQELVK